jgi:hypothetical protein
VNALPFERRWTTPPVEPIDEQHVVGGAIRERTTLRGQPGPRGAPRRPRPPVARARPRSPRRAPRAPPTVRAARRRRRGRTRPPADRARATRGRVERPPCTARHRPVAGRSRGAAARSPPRGDGRAARRRPLHASRRRGGSRDDAQEPAAAAGVDEPLGELRHRRPVDPAAQRTLADGERPWLAAARAGDQRRDVLSTLHEGG